jgi:hypothetical protein
MALRFLPAYIRFNRISRTVHVVGDCDGITVDVLICRAAIEHLAGVDSLDKNESITTVVRNKANLQLAAEVALVRFGAGRRAVAVELDDLLLIEADCRLELPSPHAHLS